MHDHSREAGESAYVFYMHSGWPDVVKFRQLVERWLLNYPDDDLDRLLSRFQARKAKEDEQYHAAVFELFLHEYLRGFTDRIEIESAIPGSDKRADFGLHFADGSRLLVEALSVQPTLRAPSPNLDQVMGYVAEMESTGFSLCFGPVATDLPGTLKRTHVQAWARRIVERCDWYNANAHAEITGNRLIPVKPLRWDDWSIDARLYVKLPDEQLDGPLLERGRVVAWSGDEADLIRHKVRKKISEKTPDSNDTPFILAVNIENHLLQPTDQELEILYGFKPRIRFTTEVLDGQVVGGDAQKMYSAKGTKGVWSTSDNEAQYRRCGAIWFFHQVGVVHPRGSRRALSLNPFVSHEFRMLMLHAYATAGAGLPR